jgi:hypothetical protein
MCDLLGECPVTTLTVSLELLMLLTYSIITYSIVCVFF